MAVAHLGLLFLAAYFDLAFGFKCGKGVEKLQVHIVSHSHDDVGWVKTVDQYYYGAKKSLTGGGVQYILDSVIASLLQNKARKFIYVEMAFFTRWWNEQDDSMKQAVKGLVKSGQLEFINGGWSMNDEAATHYNAIIDQMTYGLRFINDTFGSEARPKIAWHIDPFGHSAEQASLFSMMSFDGFFFGRIDRQDMAKRLQEQRMEMVWRGSRNFEKSSQIFTGVLYYLYMPPPGFCYAWYCTDQPIMDDPRLFDVNVKEKVDAFVSYVCKQALYYKTKNVIITMGSDFTYENANAWFKNIDKLIHYVNKDGRVNAFYSTPSIYLKSLHDAAEVWSVKTDDFFPYAHCTHCYWTGYFTSRPALKGYIRKNNNLLQVCKQLEALNGLNDGYPTSTALKKAMGVNQHHDAITGTERQHVAYDYAQRLAIGEKECQDLLAKAIGQRTSRSKSKTAGPNFEFCNYLNVSICPVTEKSLSLTVNVYNGIGRPVSTYVRFPVTTPNIAVFGSNGKTLQSQVIAVSKETASVRGNQGSAPYELVYKVDVKPLGFDTTFVEQKNSAKDYLAQNAAPVEEVNTGNYIENEKLRIEYSPTTGRITKITRKDIGLSIDVDQQFLWYTASTGDHVSRQPSGAYIFRPNSTKPSPVCDGNIAKVTVISGKLVQEIRQNFGPFVSQVIRLYSGESSAEFEYTVGPIPIKDGFGKEVISFFQTNVKSEKLFYTDANGREVKERRRDYRATWDYKVTEPVSGNYYPVNSRIFIKDSKAQLSVMTDRSHGGSSIYDGSIEIMLHRRLLHDDYLGVNQALNEPGLDGKGLIVRGKHRVLLTTPEEGPKFHRDLGEKMLIGPIVSFAARKQSIADWLKEHQPTYTALQRPLPDNVHLLTFEAVDRNRVLMRFEHFYAKSEDATLSKPATVNLNGLFTEFEISDFVELNLGANQFASEKRPLDWHTTSDDSGRKQPPKCINRVGSNLAVVLGPMQICTFDCVILRK